MATVRSGLSRLSASYKDLGYSRRLSYVRGLPASFGTSGFKAAGTAAVRGGHGSGEPIALNWTNSFYLPLQWNCLAMEYAVDRRLCGRAKGQSAAHLSLRSFGSGTGAMHVLRVPPLGDSITEGTVVEWRFGPGSMVHAEDVVCVLETDKVSVDIPAKISGKIVSIAVEVGGTAFVGGDLAVIEPSSVETGGETVPSPTPPSGATPAQHTPPAASSVAEPYGLAARVSTPVSDEPQKPLRYKPRIMFKSVRSRLERLGLLPPQQQGEAPPAAGAPCKAAPPQQGKGGSEWENAAASGPNATVVNYKAIEDLPTFLMRPALSPEEVEAINEGGLTDVDAAASAWTVSLAFRPVASKKSSSSKRSSA
ncbi:putative dihydrolipoamide acyltransferase [Cyclospora cayetanensis]|uniref:Dihydrolipoamide acyltransferase n=1 Tax=Cyclospora cayetanensis TaxID=88456 RepID=A0A1D3CWN3_9EIME|nr:putative dihydrolipoamide acyltransferase [Cyclospora cayetanensis]